MSDDLIHGGALDQMRARFPNATPPWIDLSTGINPWPYPFDALTPERLQSLPSTSLRQACRAAMAEAINAPAEPLLLAPGSELLIRLLPTVLSPRRVAILAPTYGDHAETWRAAGCEVIETDTPLDLVSEVDVVVICNSNNPDGRCFEPEALDAGRRQLAGRGGYLIIDEAYADLTPDLSLAPLGGAEGLIILRSFGKFYGLAGLRLGAVLAPEKIRRALSQRLGVWPVSTAALEIARAAYADHGWQARMRDRLRAERSNLDAVLGRPGIRVVGGTDLFAYIGVPDAHAVWEQLAEAGLYVRRFEWSNEHLRIGLPDSDAARRRLSEALSLLA